MHENWFVLSALPKAITDIENNAHDAHKLHHCYVSLQGELRVP
jgi:hypothetical protein